MRKKLILISIALLSLTFFWTPTVTPIADVNKPSLNVPEKEAPVFKRPVDWYYKPGYVDYCPNGMPDFSQRQDFTQPPDQIIDAGFCGPVALANCFWWFDSKFEPNPVPPPVVNDHYPLLQTYATMQPVWDDHDALNVQPFVAALGVSFNTNLHGPGTLNTDMDLGIKAWLQSRGLLDKYTVNLYFSPTDWGFLAHEVRRSQDVILLLGFYVAVGGDPLNCCRLGGHYVTIAGVDSANFTLALSDPDLDAVNPEPPSHNDAAIVSHDVYNILNMPPMLCNPEAGSLWLPNYPGTQVAYDFLMQNGGSTCPMPPPQGPIFTVVESAEIICPVLQVDTCQYYKPAYPDYSPVGMPDFDQKQNGWTGFNGGWSFCGPVAALNCLWWFDSKYERNTFPPPSNIDTYPLLSTMSPVQDDHDPLSVIPYVNALAPMMNCMVGGNGTSIFGMQAGLQQWIDLAGLHDSFTVTIYPDPPWTVMRDSLLKSQDVILLLGFWQEVAAGTCCRIGGHWVTMAGVCTTTTRICISDPFYDHLEGEPPVGLHAPSVHNDAQFVSGPHGSRYHDEYNLAPRQFICPTQIPLTLELTDYPDDFTYISQFYEMNQPIDPPIVCQPTPGFPVYTMIEWAVMVCPKPRPCDCRPGDSNGDATRNISDAVYLISYIFSHGAAPTPYPICSGDANCDCTVNISDAVYLIAYIFSGGAPPCDCSQWLINCGPPLR